MEAKCSTSLIIAEFIEKFSLNMKPVYSRKNNLQGYHLYSKNEVIRYWVNNATIEILLNQFCMKIYSNFLKEKYTFLELNNSRYIYLKTSDFCNVILNHIYIPKEMDFIDPKDYCEEDVNYGIENIEKYETKDEFSRSYGEASHNIEYIIDKYIISEFTHDMERNCSIKEVTPIDLLLYCHENSLINETDMFNYIAINRKKI